MKNLIFSPFDIQNDIDWAAKAFLNSICDQDMFLWALPLIISRQGCSSNEVSCFFPDYTDYDPAWHFSGVKFGFVNENVIVSEEKTAEYLAKTCQQFLIENPSEEPTIATIFNENENVFSNCIRRILFDQYNIDLICR